MHPGGGFNSKCGKKCRIVNLRATYEQFANNLRMFQFLYRKSEPYIFATFCGKSVAKFLASFAGKYAEPWLVLKNCSQVERCVTFISISKYFYEGFPTLKKLLEKARNFCGILFATLRIETIVKDTKLLRRILQQKPVVSCELKPPPVQLFGHPYSAS